MDSTRFTVKNILSYMIIPIIVTAFSYLLGITDVEEITLNKALTFLVFIIAYALGSIALNRYFARHPKKFPPGPPIKYSNKTYEQIQQEKRKS